MKATGIDVPPEVLEQLGAGKRPAVQVTIGGHTLATTIGSMGGVAKIPVSAAVRTAAYVSWIEQAKKPETRQERVTRTAELLSQQRPSR
jgi:hypothetical protein